MLSENERKQQMAVVAKGPDAEQSPDSEPPQKPASWGQFLLPLLFAAMETCWIDAIFIGLANTDVLGTSQILFPLWLPFALIGSFYVLVSYQKWYAGDDVQSLSHKGKRITLATLIDISLIGLVTLFAVWVSYYAPQTFFLDPNWLLNLPAAILQFNPDSFRLIGVIVLSIAFCRQGIFLVQVKFNDTLVSKMLQSGIFTFILLLVIRKFLEVNGKVFDDGLTVPTLIFLYFCLSLVTHSFARVGFVRRRYTIAQIARTDDVRRQERVTLQSVLLTSSVILCIALMIGAILNDTVLAGIGSLLYNRPSSIANFFGFPTIPPPCHVHCATPSTPQKNVPSVVPPSITVPPVVIFVVSIALLLLFMLAIILLVIKFVRLWRKRDRQLRRWEIHESLWSWSLFWEQCKGFIAPLITFLMFYKLRRKGRQHFGKQDSYVLAADDVHKIYRSLLTFAARQGYPRANYETPYEFRLRLTQHYPLIEPQLTLITDVYVKIRYGASTSVRNDATDIQYAWAELEQNWR